jgi:drug/metabolite transporter (DMT)-like permease
MFPSILTLFLWALSINCAHRSAVLLKSGAKANLTRLALGMVMLALWAHLFGKGVSGVGLWWFVLSGFIGFGLGDVGLFETLPRLGPRLTVVLAQCLAAVFGALIEWLWLGTTLTLAQIGAGAMILTGVALALAPEKQEPRERRTLVLGLLFGALAALGQAGGAVLSRKAYQVAHMAGQTLDGGTAAYQRILGGIGVAAAFSLWVRFRGNGETTTPAMWRAAAPWITMNALAGPVVGVACFQWALATTPSGVVLPIVSMAPLAVTAGAYLIHGERPSARSLIGDILAVTGVVLMTLSK